MSLIEREKLIDHLNACLDESDGGTPITDAVLVAIKCAVEQMPEVDAAPQWISVKERVPEISTSPKYRVLVNVAPSKAFSADEGGIDTDRTTDGKTFHRWGHRVTHWMPLPEPPKEEE